MCHGGSMDNCKAYSFKHACQRICTFSMLTFSGTNKEKQIKNEKKMFLCNILHGLLCKLLFGH